MNVADKVPYGWWEKQGSNPWWDRATNKVVLPDAIKDKRNIVMTLDELRQYDALLVKMKEDIERERNAVRTAVLVQERPYVSTYQMSGHPRLTHLCHVLEFMVTMAKHKLAIMQFNVAFTKRAVDAQKENDHGLES